MRDTLVMIVYGVAILGGGSAVAIGLHLWWKSLPHIGRHWRDPGARNWIYPYRRRIFVYLALVMMALWLVVLGAALQRP